MRENAEQTLAVHFEKTIVMVKMVYGVSIIAIKEHF